MNLDVASMALMASAACLAMGIAVAWLAVTEKVNGFVVFGIGLFCQAAALPILIFRDLVPVVLSMVFGNGLLAGSMALFLVGVYRFHRVKPRYELTVIPVLLVMATAAFVERPMPRIAGLALIMASQAATVMVALWTRRRETPGKSYCLLIAGSALGAVLFLMRGLIVASGPVTLISILQPHWIQTVSYVGLLVSVILYTVGIIGMYKDRSDHQLHQLAMQDELTGVANRRAILQELRQRIAESIRHNTPLCLLMIDLDHFKQVNDTHGHLAGDAALVQTATRIRERLRANDIVGRYGGEEFMVILPRTTPAEGVTIAADLRDRIRKPPISFDKGAISITSSIGVAGTDIAHTPTIDSLIQAADTALYRAKAQGRDQVAWLQGDLATPSSQDATPR
jgi:diguanylate cyclase (GGDEF)-like protein